MSGMANEVCPRIHAKLKEEEKRKKEKGKRIKDKGEQAQVSFNVYPLYPLSFYIRNRNYNFLII
jgi:hypothetical protein